MSEIPEDLRAGYDTAVKARDNLAEHIHVDPQGIVMAIERIARAEAKVAALEAENGRLRAPVSDAEWEAANYRQAVETGLGESSTGGEMLVWRSYTSRDKLDALIAARAQQPSPAQDKEQP